MTPKLAIFIPLKGTPSKRVLKKNFRTLGNIPLLAWTLKSLSELKKSGIKFDLYIDTESDYVFSYALDVTNKYISDSQFLVKRHFRMPSLSEDSANGNHLLASYIECHPLYSFYLQTHITTPFSSAQTYKNICNKLFQSQSVYSASLLSGWIRKNNHPINYDCTKAEGLGRSQDKQLIMESTDTYGVSKEFFDKFKVRTNHTSEPVICSEIEAIDIDTEFDFFIAEQVAKAILPFYNFLDTASIQF